MFFDVFSVLCRRKGISFYKACTDIGLNRSAVAKWKNGALPTGQTLAKLAAYFGVSTDYLMGVDTEAQIDVIKNKITALEASLDFADDPIEQEEIEKNIEAMEKALADLCSARTLKKEKTPTPVSEDELDDMEKLLMSYVKTLTPDQKQMLFAQMQVMKESQKVSSTSSSPKSVDETLSKFEHPVRS